MRKIYHVHYLETGVDHYFGSVQAMVINQGDKLGIGENTLYRETWREPRYTKTGAIIKLGFLQTTNTVRAVRTHARTKAKHVPTRKLKH